MDASPKDEKQVDDQRRTFLKATVVASAALAVGGMAAVAKVVGETGSDSVATNGTTFPKFLIADINSNVVANVNTMEVNTPLTYFYPLDNEPNIIVKLGVAVEDGVGPNSDIISFSDLCQHLGCNPGFVAPGGSPPCNAGYVAQKAVMYCCCHGSIYDLENDANVIGGPAPRGVPRVLLDVDGTTGDIYAIGMAPPVIYGHGLPGSTDVSTDLQGGSLVTSSTSSSVSS